LATLLEPPIGQGCPFDFSEPFRSMPSGIATLGVLTQMAKTIYHSDMARAMASNSAQPLCELL